MSSLEGMLLALNSGSSSLKFAVFDGDNALCRGKIDRLAGEFPSKLTVHGIHSPNSGSEFSVRSHVDALEWIIDHWDELAGGAPLVAVGHRVVHGGNLFLHPVKVDHDNLRAMESLIPLAPLHQPHNLAAIRHLLSKHPNLPQVACFDTAFHASQPWIERMLPLPRSFAERGIVRYGFHGLSYESIARSLRQLDPEHAGGRAIGLHLGNGSSACAMNNGVSVATTMGFTTVDGLMMGTRTGTLDPGVILHLLEEEKFTPRDLHELLYARSGLLGVSGISPDMRDLLASADPHAKEAVELFCHRASKEIGSLAASLGGLDTLVFTGGIGEHAELVREKIVARVQWLAPTRARNLRPVEPSTHWHPLDVRVIPTDEEQVIARHVYSVLNTNRTF